MNAQALKGPLLVEESPALARPDWIPETKWDDLEEIRAKHQRLLRAEAEIIEESSVLHRRYEAEEKARAAELQASYRDGTDPKDLPEVTPPEQREAEEADIKERRDAINTALDDFLREAERKLEDRAPDWLADLDASDAEAFARYEEAKRIAEEARNDVASRKKLRMWIEREAGRHMTFKTTPARHFPYAEMGDPPIENSPIDPETLRGGIQVG